MCCIADWCWLFCQVPRVLSLSHESTPHCLGDKVTSWLLLALSLVYAYRMEFCFAFPRSKVAYLLVIVIRIL